MDGYTPVPPPRTDNDCWPFPCRDYHLTYGHESGEDPCACRCHPPSEAAIQAGLPGQVRGLLPPLDPPREWTFSPDDAHCGTCGGTLETHRVGPDALYCTLED